MGYLKFNEQIDSHLKFLQSHELDIEIIKIDKGFIRCRTKGKGVGRGEYCYKTKTSLLNNGLVGLMTWCRLPEGKIEIHKSYGLPPVRNESTSPGQPTSHSTLPQKDRSIEYEASKKASIFWDMSSPSGISPYLICKKVDSYGIRFRQTRFGKVAVIPMRDISGKLWSCQFLNSDGTKRFFKNARTTGLFHNLQKLTNGQAIGLTESYATAATCHQLIKVPMVCAFSSWNLERVALALQERFPDSPIILFADNDRHTQENKGVKCASEVQKKLNSRSMLMIPDFHGFPATKDHSDWNDLVRVKGFFEVREAMRVRLDK